MTMTLTGTGASAVLDGAIVQADLAPGVAGTGPCFSAYQTSSQVLSGVFTKVALPLELFDTTGAFDSTTTYRFQPAVSGYYQLSGRVLLVAPSTALMTIAFYKNGANVSQGSTSSGASNYGMGHNDLVYLNGTTDYVELWFYASGTITSGATSNGFQGFLARAA